jgi:excisionase family DNA binding protein
MKEKLNEYLTVKELSKWVKLSESHVYHLVNKKKIPHAKLGGKLLFDADKIKLWIEQLTNEIPVEEKKKKERKERVKKVKEVVQIQEEAQIEDAKEISSDDVVTTQNIADIAEPNDEDIVNSPLD